MLTKVKNRILVGFLQTAAVIIVSALHDPMFYVLLPEKLNSFFDERQEGDQKFYRSSDSFHIKHRMLLSLIFVCFQ